MSWRRYSPGDSAAASMSAEVLVDLADNGLPDLFVALIFSQPGATGHMLVAKVAHLKPEWPRAVVNIRAVLGSPPATGSTTGCRLEPRLSDSRISIAASRSGLLRRARSGQVGGGEQHRRLRSLPFLLLVNTAGRTPAVLHHRRHTGLHASLLSGLYWRYPPGGTRSEGYRSQRWRTLNRLCRNDASDPPSDGDGPAVCSRDLHSTLQPEPQVARSIAPGVQS
jgi:hypothetical protein